MVEIINKTLNIIANFSDNNIRKYFGSSTIAKMCDVRRVIDGPRGITLAALWCWYVMLC